MRDNGNTGSALSSEAVDAQFWALICDDEEWLRTEFNGIVSEPAEHPTSPPPKPVIAVDQDRPNTFAWWTGQTGRSPRWISQLRPGRTGGHQRSPPDPVRTADSVRNETARW